MTAVVNLRESAYDVYIGRAGHGHDGYFGNPIQIGAPCPICGASAGHTRVETIACFEAYARARAHVDPEWRSRVVGLRGKRLGCFCAPLPCHGDVLARLADEWSAPTVVAMVTGHRPNKLGGYEPCEAHARIRGVLYDCLVRYRDHAAAHAHRLEVISGMALGVDQWWAEVALDLGIPVHAYLPFAAQASNWPAHAQDRWRWLISQCRSVLVCSPGGYAASKMQVRNEMMVRAAVWHIAVWDGTSGGTANCVRYMRERGITPEVIDPRAVLSGLHEV